uniref:Elongation of very long chain fatty acids protein n=1 Tax=Rhodnius prolixus TaxID=13249 RepID=T1H7Y8_RHOPR
MAGVEMMKWPSSDVKSITLSQADADVDKWPMMSSPTPIVLLIAFYLYFVLSLGPKLMVKRKPFDLKYVMIIYNLYQVVFSVWLCSHMFGSGKAFSYIYNHACMPMGRHDNPLIDLVFFVLRKKQNQVTVLHVYHHACMVISTWGYLKYVRGEQAILPGFLNCFVHVVMYSYYLLAALGPGVQKYLWWKKYLTKLQLGQFIIILMYLSSMIIMDCKVPRGLTLYMSMNTLIFLILFLNFYNKSYLRAAKTSVNAANNGSLQQSTTVLDKQQLTKNL